MMNHIIMILCLPEVGLEGEGREGLGRGKELEYGNLGTERGGEELEIGRKKE